MNDKTVAATIGFAYNDTPFDLHTEIVAPESEAGLKIAASTRLVSLAGESSIVFFCYLVRTFRATGIHKKLTDFAFETIYAVYKEDEHLKNARIRTRYFKFDGEASLETVPRISEPEPEQACVEFHYTVDGEVIRQSVLVPVFDEMQEKRWKDAAEIINRIVNNDDRIALTKRCLATAEKLASSGAEKFTMTGFAQCYFNCSKEEAVKKRSGLNYHFERFPLLRRQIEAHFESVKKKGQEFDTR